MQRLCVGNRETRAKTGPAPVRALGRRPLSGLPRWFLPPAAERAWTPCSIAAERAQFRPPTPKFRVF